MRAQPASGGDDSFKLLIAPHARRCDPKEHPRPIVFEQAFLANVEMQVPCQRRARPRGLANRCFV